jgi:hypothetical protein
MAGAPGGNGAPAIAGRLSMMTCQRRQEGWPRRDAYKLTPNSRAAAEFRALRSPRQHP